MMYYVQLLIVVEIFTHVPAMFLSSAVETILEANSFNKLCR